MHVVPRPYATAGVVLVGAGLIAITPVAPPVPQQVALGLTADFADWDAVFNNALGNLKDIGAAAMAAVGGEFEPVQPLELLAGIGLGPLAPLLGAATAIGQIPDQFSALLSAGSPGAALEALVNMPANVVNALINGIDFYPGLLTWDVDGEAGSGLLGVLLVGVPAMIGTLLTGQVDLGGAAAATAGVDLLDGLVESLNFDDLLTGLSEQLTGLLSTVGDTAMDTLGVELPGLIADALLS